MTGEMLLNEIESIRKECLQASTKSLILMIYG